MSNLLEQPSPKWASRLFPPEAISSSSARANANEKIRLIQPACRTTPRITPRVLATTNPKNATAMRAGRVASADMMLPSSTPPRPRA
jgi:hypothetical protein